VLAALWPAVPGAAVATAGLLPGLTEQSAPHPLVAAVALAAGLGLAVLAPVRPTAVIAGWARSRPYLAAFRAETVIMGVVAVAAVAVLVQPGAGSVVDALVTTRLSGDSPERADLRRVTRRRSGRRLQRPAVRRDRHGENEHPAVLTAQRPPRRPRPSRSRIMPSSRPSLPRSRKRSSTAISRL
jgi:hypothetical protein